MVDIVYTKNKKGEKCRNFICVRCSSWEGLGTKEVPKDGLCAVCRLKDRFKRRGEVL